MSSDKIADLISQIKNASLKNIPIVKNIAYSGIIFNIAELLKHSGYINDVKVVDIDKKKFIELGLRYVKKKSAITGIERISKPGLRKYYPCNELPYVLSGYGMAIVSTSQGVISDKQARKLLIGGEVLAKVW